MRRLLKFLIGTILYFIVLAFGWLMVPDVITSGLFMGSAVLGWTFFITLQYWESREIRS